MPIKPSVSIITPSYNNAKYISQAIESVIKQTFISWEMIIIDDCSTDSSWEIIKQYAKQDKRIKYYKNNKNYGAGITRNKAIKFASGEYIAFLDSDDIWDKKKLEVQINLMSQNKWVFSHTSYGYISEVGEKIKDTFHVSNHPIKYKDLLKRTEISCLTAIYNQNIIGKYFMSEHRKKQDYALWLSILKDGHFSYPLDIELAYYRQRPGSSTSKKYKLIFDHITFLRSTQNFNLPIALYYTIYWAFNGIYRYYLK